MVEKIPGRGDQEYGQGAGGVAGERVETEEFEVGANSELRGDEGLP